MAKICIGLEYAAMPHICQEFYAAMPHRNEEGIRAKSWWALARTGHHCFQNDRFTTVESARHRRLQNIADMHTLRHMIIKRWIYVTFSAALLVSACVSDLMRQYVGKDIREVYLEHGKPANEFVLGDGRRVFQFYWGESSAGSPYGMKGGCLLSYIAERDDAKNSWIVVDYKYPDRVFC